MKHYSEVDTSTERYDHIQDKLRAAEQKGDRTLTRLWRNKLNKWQMAYGAYGPIGRGDKY